MTEEENNAIERLWRSITDVMFCCLYSQEECDEDKRIVLKLIQKQQKQIDIMCEYIASLDNEEDICLKTEKVNCDKMSYGECEECIKHYFEKQVESEDK